MENHLKRTIVRISFDSLVDQLQAVLERDGFVVSGVTDYQEEFLNKLNAHFKKYKVLTVDIPQYSQQMLTLAPLAGAILPCHISIIESYPGEVVVIPMNPTELIARNFQDRVLQNEAEQVTMRLEKVFHELERESAGTPDLVTSWG